MGEHILKTRLALQNSVFSDSSMMPARMPGTKECLRMALSAVLAVGVL